MTTHSNTILIVDDNPDILKMLSQALVLAGYAVRTAYDGPSALTEAQQQPVDLILLDIAMPEMDGFAVCRQLKRTEATQDIPIIFMTAMSDVVDEVKGFQLGAVDYITKPFQFETVKARIHTHLTLQHLQNRLAQKNRRLQQEIAEREKTAKNLRLTQFSVDNAADAIFWIGPEARITFVNFTACEARCEWNRPDPARFGPCSGWSKEITPTLDQVATLHQRSDRIPHSRTDCERGRSINERAYDRSQQQPTQK